MQKLSDEIGNNNIGIDENNSKMICEIKVMGFWMEDLGLFNDGSV